MTFDAKQFLSSVSTSPGVYRMLDEEQNTLYVGKAKRLKARLASYFRGQLNTKTQAMVARIADIQITVTRSETEALLLEQTLIKELRPPYNILLRMINPTRLCLSLTATPTPLWNISEHASVATMAATWVPTPAAGP